MNQIFDTAIHTITEEQKIDQDASNDFRSDPPLPPQSEKPPDNNNTDNFGIFQKFYHETKTNPLNIMNSYLSVHHCKNQIRSEFMTTMRRYHMFQSKDTAYHAYLKRFGKLLQTKQHELDKNLYAFRNSIFKQILTKGSKLQESTPLIQEKTFEIIGSRIQAPIAKLVKISEGFTNGLKNGYHTILKAKIEKNFYDLSSSFTQHYRILNESSDVVGKKQAFMSLVNKNRLLINFKMTVLQKEYAHSLKSFVSQSVKQLDKWNQYFDQWHSGMIEYLETNKFAKQEKLIKFDFKIDLLESLSNTRKAFYYNYLQRNFMIGDLYHCKAIGLKFEVIIDLDPDYHKLVLKLVSHEHEYNSFDPITNFTCGDYKNFLRGNHTIFRMSYSMNPYHYQQLTGILSDGKITFDSDGEKYELIKQDKSLTHKSCSTKYSKHA